MNIVHLTSELASIAKVGGLGDVVFGLSRAQVAAGHNPRVLLPYYKCAQTNHLQHLRVISEDVWVNFDSSRFCCRIWQGQLGKLNVQLVEPLHPELFFQTEHVYGYPNDPVRFLAFVCASFTWLQVSEPVDIVHLHDWPTAAFSALSKQKKWNVPTLLTLHNVEHQGIVPNEIFERAELEAHGARSLLELGLQYADGVNAVSKTYLEEIQTPLGGHGLDKLLQNIISNCPSCGIINGIDEDYWSPSSASLPYPYSATNLKFDNSHPQCLAKRLNKRAIQQEFCLAEEDKPLVACIARLVPQKGLDLIEHALYQTLEHGGQFILLGKSPIAEVDRHFRRLELQLQDSKNARVLLTYTERLATHLFAAADLTLIPSLFEPCGLTQLIGFRYGALAIARETGGLKDTVIDLEHHPLSQDKGNGFTFMHPDFRGVNYALVRALKAWRERPLDWQKWVQRVMNLPVNWQAPCKQYMDFYKQVIDHHKSHQKLN